MKTDRFNAQQLPRPRYAYEILEHTFDGGVYTIHALNLETDHVETFEVEIEIDPPRRLIIHGNGIPDQISRFVEDRYHNR